MKIGVQNNLMLEEDLVEKAKYLQSLGIQSFEIDGAVLLEKFDEVKEMTKYVQVNSVCAGYRHWIGSYEEVERTECLHDLEKIIKKLDKLSGGGIVVPGAWALGTYRLPKMNPIRSEEETFQVLSDSLKKLDKICEGTKVKIYLEPLNRYQDFQINTLKDAVDLIEKNQLKNILITADLYHMNIEEDNIIQSIKENIKYIGHVHLAENHRFEPGTGSINFKEIFKVYDDLGFTGNAVLECRFKKETKEAFEAAINYLKG
ncbi:MAG: sugar phosphate isomerase/epimerase family protein [Lactovum sp.]